MKKISPIPFLIHSTVEAGFSAMLKHYYIRYNWYIFKAVKFI